MEDPTHKAKKVSPQAVGNITHMIPRLRSGSVRLNNFDSQNYSLTDLSQPENSRFLLKIKIVVLNHEFKKWYDELVFHCVFETMKLHVSSL
jgi:hypothetical protein